MYLPTEIVGAKLRSDRHFCPLPSPRPGVITGGRKKRAGRPVAGLRSVGTLGQFVGDSYGFWGLLGLGWIDEREREYERARDDARVHDGGWDIAVLLMSQSTHHTARGISSPSLSLSLSVCVCVYVCFPEELFPLFVHTHTAPLNSQARTRLRDDWARGGGQP